MIISEIVQLIVVGIAGAFLGELQKHTTKDIHNFKFIVQFLGNAFIGITARVIIKETFFKDKDNFFQLCLTGIMAFIGQNKSLEYIKNIIKKE